VIVLNLRKEIIAASALAIVLSAGLGIASYAMFVETMNHEAPIVKALDLYTQKGGLGANASGGIFETSEAVFLYAYLTGGGLPINNTQVTFALNGPEGKVSRLAPTNVSGIATADFNLSSEPSVIGVWTVSAVADIDGEVISDFLSFGCRARNVPAKSLDVYTQKGGLGANASGGTFEPSDVVYPYAHLLSGNSPVKDTQVAFTFRNPEIEVTKSAFTDEQGIAGVNLTLSAEQPIIGLWNLSATANVDGENVGDFMNFSCYATSVHITVHTEKNGLATSVFLPNENVSAVVLVTHKDVAVGSIQAVFEVRFPNDTVFLTQSLATDITGSATLTFQIPWPSSGLLGDWHVTVQSEVYQQHLEASVDFECQLLPIVIDVYTQKGGSGQNTPGGIFVLGETVYLYAEIRDSLNEPVVNKAVGFTIDSPSGIKFLGQVALTNSSGIATVTFRIPLDVSFVGTFEVYARAEYNDAVLLDTLTFKCEQQG
jgi:hypothetical protein